MTLRKPYKILLAALVVLGLVFIAWFFLSGISRHPKLAISYLSVTNDSGRWIAFFAVTNTGNSPAITTAATPGYGIIEELGKGAAATFRLSHRRLLPGEGDVIQVILPPNLKGRWRYTAFYAHEGPRSRVYDLQWGPHGLGTRINWLVPKFLKGLPLDVAARSDWIGDAQPTNTAIRPTSISIESVGNTN